jgi:putative alpha-1,2-mannosidase
VLIACRATWNKVLGTVEVDATGVSADTQELFWSSLYRTYISPTNITGKYSFPILSFVANFNI